jgi:hypothetical protein
MLPIFVVGCPRSGTTLVGRCLGSHPDVAVADESLFLLDLGRIYRNLFLGRNKRNWAPLSEYIEEDELIRTSRSFADSVFSALLRKTGRTRYVDHTPWYALQMDFISLLFPEAKFIHLIRDGRDVALSLNRAYEAGYDWAGSSLTQRADLWVRCVGRAKASGSQLGDKRYRELRYETLCANPTEVLDDLLTFLELSKDRKVYQPLALPHATPSRHNMLLAEPAAGGGCALVTPRKVGYEWPELWSSEDRHTWEATAGSLMAQLNYHE